MSLKVFLSKSFMHERGITVLRRNAYVSQYRQILSGNPSLFQKISVIEKFYG